MLEIFRQKREEILRVCTRYGARNVRVFGSVARGEADEASDIDLVVEFDLGRSLLDHAGLLIEPEGGCGLGAGPKRTAKEAVPV